MADEHVTTPQGAGGSPGSGAEDDASKRIAALEERLRALQEGVDKRDAALAKMQSERDKAAKKLDLSQKRQERLEAAQKREVSKLPADAQAQYLRDYAAEQTQKATRFELAHQYGLDPMELEGEYSTPEAMRLHAVELAQAKGTQDLEGKVLQLTTLVEQLTALQAKAGEGEGTGETVTPDPGGPRVSQLPPADVLKEFDALAERYRREGRHDLAAQTILAKIHRDPAKIMGPATPSEQLPPGLANKLRR